MGYSRIRPRTLPVDRDESAVAAFKEQFGREFRDREVWFYDETGVDNDGTPRRTWARRGSTPVCFYRGNHIRENVVGAVNPCTGDLETLIMPYNDARVFQRFLDYFAQRTDNRPVIMVLDNASWHKTKSLQWGNVTPVYLPAYSPDLNPIEELWKVLKDRLCDPIPARTHDELQRRIQKVLRSFFNNQYEVKSICKLHY